MLHVESSQLRDIIVRYGLTEQEVLALVREGREKEGPLAEKLAEFAQKLGVTESAVQNFFRILDEKQVPTERLPETLADIARLEEAVAAYREALAVFKHAQAPYYIEKAKANLARAQTLLQERQSKEGSSRAAQDRAL